MNRNPSSDKELVNKKYIDDELDKNTIVRFNQTLESYLKVSIGNNTYNLTKHDKISIRDTTEIRAPCNGNDLLQNWKIINTIKNNDMKVGKFPKSTITASSTPKLGATCLSPIGSASMYIGTSSNNHGSNAFVSFERTDIIQITITTFYYNRFSVFTDDSLKSMGR